MSLITLQDFHQKFSTDFPEMTEFYYFDEELIEDYGFDQSDTYIDTDDYEYQQRNY